MGAMLTVVALVRVLWREVRDRVARDFGRGGSDASTRAADAGPNFGRDFATGGVRGTATADESGPKFVRDFAVSAARQQDAAAQADREFPGAAPERADAAQARFFSDAPQQSGDAVASGVPNGDGSASGDPPRCWNVWRADPLCAWVLDRRGASRGTDGAIARAWLWQQLGCPAMVVRSGIDPNALPVERVRVETVRGVSVVVPGPLRH